MAEQAKDGIIKDIPKKQQDWIKYPIEKAEILRKEAEKAGEDVDNIFLGYVLDVILNDDETSFLITTGFGEYDLKDIEYSRTGILGRLSLEIDFEETPEELRKQLELARDKLQEHAWIGEEGFNEAHKTWKETVKNWTLNFRDTNPEIKEAYEKFQSFDIGLSKALPRKV